MHFQVPKPLWGWRTFAGEVGIIVLGVLIALAAQQIVQDMHTRAEVRAFRETIDHEIGLNLYIYDVRSRQLACDEHRGLELKGWLARARAGEQVPPLWPRGPFTLTPYRSAWDNRDAQVFGHIPAAQRQKYAEFYDELSNNWAIIEGEQAQWGQLRPYAEIGPISLADRRALRTIIAEIRADNQLLGENLPISRSIAEVLGAKVVKPDGLPALWLKQIAECRSVITSPTEASELNPRA